MSPEVQLLTITQRIAGEVFALHEIVQLLIDESPDRKAIDKRVRERLELAITICLNDGNSDAFREGVEKVASKLQAHPKRDV
jgi:hypothetical protein